MLVLTRRLGEKIRIGDDIELVITDIKQDSVKIGINAPREVEVFRVEVYEAIQQANKAAALGTKSFDTINNLLQDWKGKVGD